jgi:Dolichyl-phosphate-mannose-protein mannosyltransferase
VTFWLVYGVVFVLMLWALSPGRTLQDALSAELLQGHLAGGYQLRNPPLYEWLLFGFQQVFGSGPLSYLALRYSLMATIGILFYAALLRVVTNEVVAAAFSLSLLLFFWFGWEAHHSISHSLALLAASLALLISALSYVDRPTSGRAILLGFIVGLGLMAKWSFVLVLVSLGAALALTPETRWIFVNPRTLLVPLFAVLPALPFVVWLANLDSGLLFSRAAPSSQSVNFQQAQRGAFVFLTGIPLVFLPWIVFVLGFATRFQTQGGKGGSNAATRIALITACVGPLLMALSILAVTFGGVALFGITRFAIHYLFPFCLFAALAIAGVVARRVITEPFAVMLAATSLLVAGVIFLVKLGSFFVVPERFEATNLAPYAELAKELTRRGLGSAQFVTLSPRDAGNLRIYLPEAHALSLSARIEPPLRDTVANRQCLILWGGDYSVPPRPASKTRGIDRFLKLLGIAADAETAEDIAIDWRRPLLGEKRRFIWHVLRGDEIQSNCQRVARRGRQ